MKIKFPNGWQLLAIGLAALILCAILIMAGGCNTTKEVNKMSYDSTSLTQKDDSIRLLKSERDRFEELYNELIYSNVIFDTVRTTDTVNHFNTIYITKEGEIKASGNIKSANVSKSIIQSIILAKDKTIDSLKNVKNKVVTEVHEVVKEKKVKRNFWLYFFLGAAVASIVWNYKRILSLIKFI